MNRECRFHNKLILLISNVKFAEFSFLLPWVTGAWGLFYLGQVLSNFGMLANKTSVYILIVQLVHPIS